MATRNNSADETRDLRDRNIRGKGDSNSGNFAQTEKEKDGSGEKRRIEAGKAWNGCDDARTLLSSTFCK